MSLVALVGGSFNPPTEHHLEVARRVLGMNLFDELWFVPSGGHPFAPSTSSKDGLAPMSLRVQMLEALITDSRMRVSRVEETLPPPTYTYLTLNEMCRLHPEHHFFWVVGTDCVNQFPNWKYIDDLLANHMLMVVPRGGVVPNGNPFWSKLTHPHMVVSSKNFPPISGSSTEARENPQTLPEAVRGLWESHVNGGL